MNILSYIAHSFDYTIHIIHHHHINFNYGIFGWSDKLLGTFKSNSEEKKKPVKKPKEDGTEYSEQKSTNEMILSDPKSIAPGLVELLNDDDEEEIQQPPANNGYPNLQKPFPQKKEAAFNIEFEKEWC